MKASAAAGVCGYANPTLKRKNFLELMVHKRHETDLEL